MRSSVEDFFQAAFDVLNGQGVDDRQSSSRRRFPFESRRSANTLSPTSKTVGAVADLVTALAQGVRGAKQAAE